MPEHSTKLSKAQRAQQKKLLQGTIHIFQSCIQYQIPVRKKKFPRHGQPSQPSSASPIRRGPPTSLPSSMLLSNMYKVIGDLFPFSCLSIRSSSSYQVIHHFKSPASEVWSTNLHIPFFLSWIYISSSFPPTCPTNTQAHVYFFPYFPLWGSSSSP